RAELGGDGLVRLADEAQGDVHRRSRHPPGPREGTFLAELAREPIRFADEPIVEVEREEQAHGELLLSLAAAIRLVLPFGAPARARAAISAARGRAARW